MRNLTRELIADSASSYRWCDLAEALLASGDEAKAAYCVRRAIALAPNVAPILLRVANFDIRTGAGAPAFEPLKRILAITAEYDAIVFSDFDRFGGGVDAVLTSGIPSEKRAAQAYFRHLIATQAAPGDVRKTWDWLTARSLADEPAAIEYVNHLVATKQYLEAAERWGETVGARRGDYLRPNRIFDPGFKFAPSGAVLDWTITNVEGVQIKQEAGALRLDFQAQNNLSFNHVSQQVVVTPGRYRLEARVKAEGITTDRGIGFHLFDAEQPSRLDVALEAALGTMPWTRQEATFTVPPATGLLRVELRRQPSQKFDNKIQGTLWVDSVKLYSIP